VNSCECFTKLIDGKFYGPACEVLEQIPEDAPENFSMYDLLGSYACSPECSERGWAALKAAADARRAKSNGKAN
jgi:hypothetical protein